MKIYETSAFVLNGKGGNKAGVVFEDCPDTGRRVMIAKELGYSETVFVSKDSEADYRLEYYTPEGEVDLCGHATIATFATMASLNMLNKSELTIRTKAGQLRITADENGLISMEQNLPEFYGEIAKEDLDRCFEGIEYNSYIKPEIVSTGLKDMIVGVRDQSILDDMKPDFGVISEVSEKYGVVGIHAFALSDKEGIDAYCRNFAPLCGIDEEAATGTSSCALTALLFKYGIRKPEYLFRQGVKMNSESEIRTSITYDADISEIWVAGYGKIENIIEI